MLIQKPGRLATSTFTASILAVVAVGAFGLNGIAAAQANDPVIFSFATVGDSRTDPVKADATTLLANPSPTTQGGAPSLTGTILPQDNEWVQNTLAFGQILSGIQSQNPNLLFFNGDMIFGYGRPTLPTAWANGKPNSWTTAQTVSPDTIFEYLQYAYWRGMVANLFLTGTYVMPVPGNHETQCSYSAGPYSSANPNPNCNTAAQGNLTGKTAYADNENMFRFNMGDLVQDLVTNLRFSNVSGFFAQNVSGLTASTAPVASQQRSDHRQSGGAHLFVRHSGSAGIAAAFRGHQHRSVGRGFDRTHRLAGRRFRGGPGSGRGAFLRVRTQAGVHVQLCSRHGRQRQSAELQLAGPRRSRCQLCHGRHLSRVYVHRAVPERVLGIDHRIRCDLFLRA